MRYKPFGRTGLFVSEMCLGTMTFGGSAGLWSKIGGLGPLEAERLIGTAVDAGINFIDTADVYAGGESEEITGRALRKLSVSRDQLVIATKVFGDMGPGPNARGASRQHIMDGIAASLRRLQLDHIDLYQIHGFDPATPVEETVRALDNLVQRGLVRYIGISNWAAWQITKALGISERLGLARFESVQAYYTIAGRDIERELVPMMLSEQLALLVWSPLAGGLLSGKYADDARMGTAGRRSSFDFPPVNIERVGMCLEVLGTISRARDVSVAQVALSWLLHQTVVTSVIIGAKNVDQLSDNLAAADLALSPEELAKIDLPSRLPPEYPGWIFDFLGKQRRQQLADSSRSALIPTSTVTTEDPAAPRRR